MDFAILTQVFFLVPYPQNREYGSAPGTRQARQAKLSHALVWPLELGLRTPTLRCGHLRGNVSAPGACWASFVTRALPVDCCR